MQRALQGGVVHLSVLQAPGGWAPTRLVPGIHLSSTRAEQEDGGQGRARRKRQGKRRAGDRP